MTNKTHLNSQQKAILEQKRLIISDAILRKRGKTLRHLCDHFHFQNTDLLEVEFAEYQQTKNMYDKAYTVSTLLNLEEATALIPKVQEGDNIVLECLKLARKKERENSKKIAFLTILAQLFHSPRNARKQFHFLQNTK